MKRLFRWVGRCIAGGWRFLTFCRTAAVNLMFVVLVAIALVALFSDRSPKLPDRAALVLSPSGTIVEQQTEFRLGKQLLDDEGPSETLLQDIIDAVDHSAGDPRIQAIYLDLRKLENAGLSKLQEIGSALKRFRGSGKPVIAWADYYNQRHYYLAAHANRVYVNPLGGVLLTGLGVYQNYYKSALEKLRIQFHVFRVGQYKSALEPVLRDDMSEFDREANRAMLGVLWSAYTADVAGMRGVEPASLDDYINSFPAHLAASGGQLGVLAQNYRLVDGLKTRDQLREEMIQLVGEDRSRKTFNQVAFADYIRYVRSAAPAAADAEKIGVIVAQGVLLEGSQPAGRIGGDSLSGLIRQARSDNRLRALVLRIDSPGGSAFASDQIRREVELARLAGLPVVVSMSSVAASGGYWIAAAADEIWAAPTTVTGSIGIFSAFPTFERSLDTIGVRNDGVGTTRLADAFNPNRPMNPLLAQSLDQLMQQGYRVFIERVATGRNMPTGEVEKIAAGRVWAGQHAQAIGLVDKLGDARDAIAAAAQRAGLVHYQVEIIQPPLSRRERLLRHLGDLVTAALRGPLEYLIPEQLSWLKRQLALPETEWLNLKDPGGLYAYCLGCGSL
ncbi:MAG: signal peptide peptidase SppA [Desulfobacterales bacterium]|jgi:protease-4|nr:signal peptide peptidase SppA [Desulfobacterales bacterium]